MCNERWTLRALHPADNRVQEMDAQLDMNGSWSMCGVIFSIIGASVGAGLSATLSCAVVYACRTSTMHVAVDIYRNLGPRLGRVEGKGAVRVQAALLGGDALGCAAGAQGGVVDARSERHAPHTVALRIQSPLPKLDIPAVAQPPSPPTLWAVMRLVLTRGGHRTHAHASSQWTGLLLVTLWLTTEGPEGRTVAGNTVHGIVLAAHARCHVRCMMVGGASCPLCHSNCRTRYRRTMPVLEIIRPVWRSARSVRRQLTYDGSAGPRGQQLPNPLQGIRDHAGHMSALQAGNGVRVTRPRMSPRGLTEVALIEHVTLRQGHACWGVGGAGARVTEGLMPVPEERVLCLEDLQDVGHLPAPQHLVEHRCPAVADGRQIGRRIRLNRPALAAEADAVRGGVMRRLLNMTLPRVRAWRMVL